MGLTYVLNIHFFLDSTNLFNHKTGQTAFKKNKGFRLTNTFVLKILPYSVHHQMSQNV